MLCFESEPQLSLNSFYWHSAVIITPTQPLYWPHTSTLKIWFMLIFSSNPQQVQIAYVYFPQCCSTYMQVIVGCRLREELCFLITAQHDIWLQEHDRLRRLWSVDTLVSPCVIILSENSKAKKRFTACHCSSLWCHLCYVTFCYVRVFFICVEFFLFLPEIPALLKAVVEPTNPEPRPQPAWQPPLQHQSCGHYLHINKAPTMTQQCTGTWFDICIRAFGCILCSLSVHLCVLPVFSKAHLSPAPPSSVCHSSWLSVDLAARCRRPQRRHSVSHGRWGE